MADFDFAGDSPDTGDATRCVFHRIFLGITFDVPRQGHKVASRSHTNFGFVEPGLPGKFVEHFLLLALINHRPKNLI